MTSSISSVVWAMCERKEQFATALIGIKPSGWAHSHTASLICILPSGRFSCPSTVHLLSLSNAFHFSTMMMTVTAYSCLFSGYLFRCSLEVPIYQAAWICILAPLLISHVTTGKLFSFCASVLCYRYKMELYM